MNNRTIGLIICLLALFLAGADNSGGQAADERAQLRHQRDALHKRVESLRNEQDFLLFQNEMYASDSKYLVINVPAKTGRLMYRNRVLKDFRFGTAKNYPHAMPGQGKLVLTKKDEAKRAQYALIFGKALVIQWKRPVVPPREAGIPVLSVTRREMKSLSYAVELGALAYVLR